MPLLLESLWKSDEVHGDQISYLTAGHSGVLLHQLGGLYRDDGRAILLVGERHKARA